MFQENFQEMIGTLYHLCKVCTSVFMSKVTNIEFYFYYFGRCSSELVGLVAVPYSQGMWTCCSNRLHDFSDIFPGCYKDVYINSFSPCTA